MSIAIEDGTYTVEVTLSGGSGKSYVESPAPLYVKDGEMQAEIVWSSPSYDYMEINGTPYYPINEEGNSVFLIDVASLDSEISVLAETVAMSEPHLIEYSLRFDSETVKSADTPFAVFIAISAALFAAVVVAGLIIKRRGKSYGSEE